jgi:hypothetical protein
MNDFEKMSLQEKWGWLCEDIENPEVRRNTMLVLENSSKFMVENDYTTNEALEELLLEVEGTNPNVSGYTGSNPAVGSGGPGNRQGVLNYVVPKVMFPVIRRVMPQLIANELVSVQPINGRTGVVFYASYQFSNDKGGVEAGDQFTGHYVIDQEGDYTDLWAKGNQAIRGQAYYSSQKCGPFTATVELTRDGADWKLGDNVVTGATAVDFKFDTKLHKFFKATPELLALELYPILGGPVVEYKTGDYTYTVAGTAPDETSEVEFEYTIDVGAVTAGKTETFTYELPYEIFLNYNQESSVNIPEMQFTLDSKNIETKERKLKVRYTREAAQDLKAHHQLDLEAELVKMATADMNYEIDREIIHFIDRNVPAQLRWSHNWNFAGASGTVYNFLDRHRALAQSIYALAGRMAQYNRQGAANWAVVSPKVAAVLQMLPEFSKEQVSLSPNIYTIGSLNKIRYFVDPNRVGPDADTILMGFKSPITSYGTGIVYSPYANWMTATIIDPANFDSNKGFFSRYAITLLPRGQWFYAKLHLTGLGDGFGG